MINFSRFCIIFLASLSKPTLAKLHDNNNNIEKKKNEITTKHTAQRRDHQELRGSIGRKLQEEDVVECVAFKDIPVDIRLNTDKNKCVSSDECFSGSCRIFPTFLDCDENDNLAGAFPRVCSTDEITREMDCVLPSSLGDNVLNHTSTQCQSNDQCPNGGSCRLFGSFLGCDANNNFAGIFEPLCDNVEVEVTTPIRQDLECVPLESLDLMVIFNSESECWADYYCSGRCRAFEEVLSCDDDDKYFGVEPPVCPFVLP